MLSFQCVLVSTLLEKFGQIGSSPQIEATKRNKYLKLPPIVHYSCYMTVHTPVNCLLFQTFITKCRRIVPRPSMRGPEFLPPMFELLHLSTTPKTKGTP